MNKCNYKLLCILNICSLPCERQYNEVDCRVILYWGIRVDTRIRLLRFKFCCQFWYLCDFRKIISLPTHFLNEDGNSNLLYMVGVDIKRLFMQKISIMQIICISNLFCLLGVVSYCIILFENDTEAYFIKQPLISSRVQI